MARCMAEHGLDEPVIGVCFDGTGFGLDGAVCGGEFLVGDCAGFRRAAHLRYVPMPGGDHAVRDPWRMAMAHLDDAGVESQAVLGRVDAASVRTTRRTIERRLNAPLTSSVGRLIDAVASLVGARDHVGYEGQAAIQLEGLAAGAAADGAHVFDLTAELTLDTRPLIRDVAPERVARRFHTVLAEMFAATCVRLREGTGLSKVVLSGCVFTNAPLAGEAEYALLSLVMVPTSMAAILAAPGNRVEGFLGPGHVCTVMGFNEYDPIARQFHVPIVVTGFVPVDMLEGILMTVRQLEAGTATVGNQHARAVLREGNP